jgi:acetoin:2,6-dichlorophenolindophenol oxidoreductase subunit beta
MPKLSFRDAIREALIEEMRRSPAMFAIGEDLIPQGGSFGVHKGLAEMFPGRILQTPISEAAIVGVAVGGALAGGPVVAEIMFSDFMTCCMDEVVNQAAKLRYMSGGQARVPLVVRTPCGLGKGIAAQHSQALETFYMHVPGLQVAVPSTPADAKGLLKSALRSDNPTIFLEYKLLYTIEDEVPDDPDYLVPFGKARIHRDGRDVTVVATGRMVHFALAASKVLAEEGIEAEIIDPRTLSPLDLDTLTASVKRTARAVIVDEAVMTCSPASEIAASLSETCFGWLDAPIKRVASPHVPKPFTPLLEALSIPDTAAIVAAVRSVCGARA